VVNGKKVTISPDVGYLLKRGVAEIIVEDEMKALLRSGKKLRLKEGFDPSFPDIHLGHMVALRKLRQHRLISRQEQLEKKPQRPPQRPQKPPLRRLSFVSVRKQNNLKRHCRLCQRGMFDYGGETDQERRVNALRMTCPESRCHSPTLDHLPLPKPRTDRAAVPGRYVFVQLLLPRLRCGVDGRLLTAQREHRPL